MALALDLEPSPGLREALEHPGRIDALFIDRAMIKHSDTLYVLSGEESLGDPVAADTSSLDILLKELRGKFHYVVVDVPRQVSPATQYVAQNATNLVLVTDLSLAGMRDTLRQLAMLPTTNAACQVTVVANRVGEYREGEIARKEFEAAVGRAVDFVIPFDAKSVAAATNVGSARGRRPRSGGAGDPAGHRARGRQPRDLGEAAPAAALAAVQAMSMFGRRSLALPQAAEEAATAGPAATLEALPPPPGGAALPTAAPGNAGTARRQRSRTVGSRR